MESRVRLNVGGEIFETSTSTLERAGRFSVLGALLDPSWRHGSEEAPDGLPVFNPALVSRRDSMSAPTSPMLCFSDPQSAKTSAGPARVGRPVCRSCPDVRCNCPHTPILGTAMRGIRRSILAGSPPVHPDSAFQLPPSASPAGQLLEEEPSLASPAPSRSHSAHHRSVSAPLGERTPLSTPVTGNALLFASPAAHCGHTGCAPASGRESWEPSPVQAAECGTTQQPVKEIFLDRDPAVFRVLLNMLRTGHVDLSSGVSLEAVLADADYLGFLDKVKGALLPQPLDANEMAKVDTLSPNVGPMDACTAMCGNPDGSLTVAHGGRITAYDWSLHRIQTLFSEIPQIDAIAHLSENRIVVGGAKGCDHLPIYDLRASSIRSAKVHSIACEGASHPCFRAFATSDRFLFVASLRKTLGAEWGVGKAVGMVDRETLKCVGKQGPAPLTTRRLAGPDKLQWIPSRGLLLVAKRFSSWNGGTQEGTSYMRLWDPRCAAAVWDWREYEDATATATFQAERWFALCDAVVCEELSLLFKASPTSADSLSSRLSAIDLRCLSSSTTPTISTPSFNLSPVSTSSSPATPSSASPPSTAPVPSLAAPPSSRNVATGHDGWSVLQWQTSEGLRIGAPARDPRFESQNLRLVVVPGTCQVICNRQPTLEVWSPIAQLPVDQPDGLPIGITPRGPVGQIDPYMFRRSFADSREEYNRKRMNCPSMGSWVYDMTLAGDHRLFVVREDNRQGLVDYGSIEVWETRRSVAGSPRF